MFYRFSLIRAACAGLALALGTLVAAPIQASQPVEAFAALPDMASVHVSPSGRYIAYETSLDGRTHVAIQDLTGQEQTQYIAPYRPKNGGDAELFAYRWKSDQYMVFVYSYRDKVGGKAYRMGRVMSLDRKTGKWLNLFRLDRTTQKTSGFQEAYVIANSTIRVVDYLPDDPDHVLASMVRTNIRDWVHEVVKIDLRTGRTETVTGGMKDVSYYITDRQHELRMAYGQISGRGTAMDKDTAFYRDPDTGKWIDVSEASWFKDDEIEPYYFFPDAHYAYVSAKDENGYKAIYKFDVKKGEKVEKIASADGYDVSNILVLPSTGEPYGAYYTGEHGQAIYFDKGLQNLQAQLAQALPGGRVGITDARLEKGLFIVQQETSATPGSYFLLDMSKGSLNLISRANRQLDYKALSPVEPISFDARDGTKIPGYLTVPISVQDHKNLPTVVLVHGGPWARDTQDYDHWVQYLADQGYAVLQINYRGSTGYGKEFEEAGYLQYGGLMQDDVTDGTKWLINEGIADKDHICIVGASYGGYAALMGAAKEPDLYSCAVSINGVADLPGMFDNDRRSFGKEKWLVERVGYKDHDLKEASPYHQVDKIIVPIQIIHARDDARVPFSQGEKMADRLKGQKKSVEFVAFDGSDHFLLTEEARLVTLKAMGAFLQKHLK